MRGEQRAKLRKEGLTLVIQRGIVLSSLLDCCDELIGRHTLQSQSEELSGAIITVIPAGSLFTRATAKSSLIIGVARMLFTLSETSSEQKS